MSLRSSQSESSLLYSQAKNLFEKAKIAIDSGTLRTETQLVYEVFSAFNAFFESVGKPNLVVRHAPEGGPPWSEDYNDMMDEIKADLEMLYAEVELIGQTLYTDFNHNTVQHDALNVRYNDILDRMKDLELYSGIANNAIQFANENFLNADQIDFSRSSLTAADVSNGSASLPIKSRVNISPNSQVSIITGNVETGKYIIGSASNGFPGNNTEVHTVTDGILTTQKYTPTFVGDQNNHGNYASVIDDNANTWFEYEKISVRDHDKITVAKNLGWSYQVNGSMNIEYVGEPTNGVLCLQMQIVLPEESIINQIFFNMYTPPNYGAKTAKIKDILVTDGRVPPYSIIPEGHNKEGYNYSFDPVSAKIIYVLFEQPEKYATDIGHIYYEKTSASNRTSDYALGGESNSSKYAQRIDGPSIPLSSLGIKVESNKTKISADYPLINASEYRENALSEIINGLSTSIEDKDADIGIEKFEGWRWCIGIRDIEIYSCEYEDEGEIVSKPFFFDKPVEKITLGTSEVLPASILEDYQTKYNYLSYYVSIDDGGTWHPITPMSHEIFSENQPPKLYTVRTVGTDSMKLTNKNAYLESETPVYSLRVKVVIKKPETVSAFTTFRAKNVENLKDRISPVLESYTINVETEGNIIDSKESTRLINARNIDKTPGELECDPMDPTGECYEGPLDDCDPDNPTAECNEKLKITIFDNPADRKKFCLGETTVVKGNYEGTHNIYKLEFYINNMLIETKEIFNVYGPIKKGEYEFTITSELLEKYFIATARGVNFDINIYVHDVLGNKRRAQMIAKFVDCVAEENENKDLRVVINNFKNKLCLCNSLEFTGRAESGLVIDPDSIRVEINGQVVDHTNIGTIDDDPCNPKPEPEPEPEPLDELDADASIPVIANERPLFNTCLTEGLTEMIIPMRMYGNHPLKRAEIYIDNVLTSSKDYEFNEMVFDDYLDVPFNGLYDQAERMIKIELFFYKGSQDKTQKFSFLPFKMTFKTTGFTCQTYDGLFATASGAVPIQPSPYYGEMGAYVDTPFYALWGNEVPSYTRIGRPKSLEAEGVKILSTQNDDYLITTNNKVEFNVKIPYWKLLQLGCTPEGKYEIKVFARDSNAEAFATKHFKMSNCVGDPRDDSDINWNREEVTCVICECYNLVVKGNFTSLEEIIETEFTINGIIVDPSAIGEPTNDMCSTSMTKSIYKETDISDHSFSIMSTEVIQKNVHFAIPYWKLIELGCLPGGSYLLTVSGKTANSKTKSVYRFKVKDDCSNPEDYEENCVVCENEDCVAEDIGDEDGGETEIEINTDMDGMVCECEDVKVKGTIISKDAPIGRVEVTINDIEIDPNNLGPIFPSICGEGEPPEEEPPTDEEEPPTNNEEEPPVDNEYDEPEGETEYIKFVNATHMTICNSENTFSTDVEILVPSPIDKLYTIWRANGKEVLNHEMSGVKGYNSIELQVGFPAYNVPINGTIETIPMYFDEGLVELEIKVHYGGKVKTKKYMLTVTECTGALKNIDYSNNLTKPNMDISFLTSEDPVDTKYWYGVHQPYRNIADDFWQGRNDWLGLLKNDKAKIDASQPFWGQLFKLFKEYISKDLLTLPEPFSAFEAWWKRDMKKYSTDHKMDKCIRATVYATYKLRQITIVYEDSLEKVAILNDGRLEELAKFIKLTPRHTYHWIDIRDIKEDKNTYAWVVSAEADFLAYMNIEESVFNGSVFSLKTHRPTNYTINEGEDFGLAKIYNNTGGTHNINNTLIGTSTFERLLFAQKEAVGILVGGETVVHEVGHAVSSYAPDAYPNKYPGENRAFHDWDEWRNISGWTLFTNADDDAIAVPYTSPEGVATSKFTKVSNNTQMLANGKEAPVTPYGCRHPAEDFAEAYAIYRINPDQLHALFPKKYAFMEKWVKDMPKNSGRVTVMNAYENEVFVLSDDKIAKNVCNCGLKIESENKQPILNLKEFQYQVMEPTTRYEFDWTIPYWKLLEIGCEFRKSYEMQIIAYTEDESMKKTARRRVVLRDCNAGPDDQPYDDACHETESVVIHYYNETQKDIVVETIPFDLLPYQIDNGSGTIAKICLRGEDARRVSVEIVESGDESGYAFQLHAAGVNYYQFGDKEDIRTAWASVVGGRKFVLNKDLMLGDPATKEIPWLNEVRAGNYENAPTLEKKTASVQFIMDKKYRDYKCDTEIDCGKLIRPTPTGKECNELTHFIIQYYSLQSYGLRIAKIPIQGEENGLYRLDETTVLKVAWDSKLEGIAAEVVEAANAQSVILTAMAIMYKKPDGVSETQWVETLRFYSQNAQNPEFILGGRKKLSQLRFVNNGVVDYSKASYIGGIGDFVVTKANEEIAKKLCDVPSQPIVNIPEEYLNPSAEFPELKICGGDGATKIQFKINDYTALKDIIYTAKASNGDIFIEDFRYEIVGSKKEAEILIWIDSKNLRAGDKVIVTATIQNILGGKKKVEHAYTVSFCDETPPEIIEFSPAMPVKGNGKYCYGDLINKKTIPMKIHAIDDRAIDNINIKLDGISVLNKSYSNNALVNNVGPVVEPISFKIPDKIVNVQTERMTKADIVFIFDTSGSLSGEIKQVRENLEAFKKNLIDQGIDAYFGYIDSNHKNSNLYMKLTPSAQFNLDAVKINSGTWENLAWKQFTDPDQGGMKFLNQFRQGASRIFIAITDAKIREGLTDDIINQMTNNKITVHFINKHPENNDYNTLMQETGGKRFSIDSTNLATELNELTDAIITDLNSFIPDKTYTFEITVTDLVGHTTTKTIEVKMTDCENERIDISEEEENITNDYSLLIRLRWGATPYDIDNYIYLDRNPLNTFSFAYTSNDPNYDPTKHKEYKCERDESGNVIGEMWLNADIIGHTTDEDFLKKYEVITMKGFPNRDITVVTRIFPHSDAWKSKEVGSSKPPVVELVDGRTGRIVKTVTKGNSEWVGQMMLRFEFQTDKDGYYARTIREPAFIQSNDPSL